MLECVYSTRLTALSGENVSGAVKLVVSCREAQGSTAKPGRLEYVPPANQTHIAGEVVSGGVSGPGLEMLGYCQVSGIDATTMGLAARGSECDDEVYYQALLYLLLVGGSLHKIQPLFDTSMRSRTAGCITRWLFLLSLPN